KRFGGDLLHGIIEREAADRRSYGPRIYRVLGTILDFVEELLKLASWRSYLSAIFEPANQQMAEQIGRETLAQIVDNQSRRYRGENAFVEVVGRIRRNLEVGAGIDLKTHGWRDIC